MQPNIEGLVSLSLELLSRDTNPLCFLYLSVLLSFSLSGLWEARENMKLIVLAML